MLIIALFGNKVIRCVPFIGFQRKEVRVSTERISICESVECRSKKICNRTFSQRSLETHTHTGTNKNPFGGVHY